MHKGSFFIIHSSFIVYFSSLSGQNQKTLVFIPLGVIVTDNNNNNNNNVIV